MSLGLALDPTCIRHNTGPDHPERPDRIRAITKALLATGLLPSPDPFPDFQINLGPLSTLQLDPLTRIPITPATLDDALLIHHPAMLDHVQRMCAAGSGLLDQSDTPVCKDSWDIALLSLGSLLSCCNAVMSGQVRRAFSCSRPPGHHAEPDRAMGFCLLSNVAIAAKHLQKRHGLSRIAVVDFDVHHGNGTQAAFMDDPSVLMISIHQHPATCYPGTGYDWEIGTSAGRGFTLNIPMPPKSDDDDYLQQFDTRIIPRLQEFQPQALLISAGFDAHADDPLADMSLSEQGFYDMTLRLARVADEVCQGRVISALEGGYNLRALARCVVQHLRALA